MKTPVTIIFFLVFIGNISAQTAAPVFGFGVKANYYSGKEIDDNSISGFDNKRVMYSLEAMLGFQTYTEKKKENNIIGIFGRIGFIPDNVLESQLNDLELSQQTDSTKSYFDFSEIEFGVISKQVFRISAGYGWLNFYDENAKPKTLNYFCATTGLSIPIGNARFDLSVTSMRGKDFNKFLFRPSAGLTIQLK